MAGLGEPKRDEMPPDRDEDKSTRGTAGDDGGKIGPARDVELERELIRLSTAICTG